MGHPALVRRIRLAASAVQIFGALRVLNGLAILSAGPRRFCSGLVEGDTELRTDALLPDGRDERMPGLGGEILLSCSDKASSCFRISAFCGLSTFSGRWANTLAITAHNTSAVATEIKGIEIISRLPGNGRRGIVRQLSWRAQITEVAVLNRSAPASWGQWPCDSYTG